MASAAVLPPFNDHVGQAIIEHTQVEPEQLIILDNSAKYSPEGISKSETNEASLAGIFDTMANVNRMALEDSRLCAGANGPCFCDALLQTADQLATLANARPVRYVELGPEPWKSRELLAHLLAAGVDLEQYVGIDINPKSEQTMREALVPIIGEPRFSYWVTDFYECKVSDYPKLPGNKSSSEDAITIVTNLGFQEGNDWPARIGPMLARLTRPGDLLLSEMQVSRGKAEAEIIKQFYHHPEMLRFSALVGQQFDAASDLENKSTSNEKPGEYLFSLVPVETDIGSVNVATTVVAVQIKGAKRYVLTNSCLKYTSDQFKQAREAYGAFAVKALQETGDRSVVFQIAQRV